MLTNKNTKRARIQRACLCSIPPTANIKVHLFRESAVVEWPSNQRLLKIEDAQNVPRGTVGDMSRKSAKRLLFALANAERPWRAMVTLTFRETPEWPKDIFRDFVRRMQKQGLCRTGWAWVMEFQQRGTIHFHVLFSADELSATGFDNPNYIQRVQRNGGETSLLRGPFERRVVNAWMLAVADLSPRFRAFQEGGIVELLNTPSSASRYFSAYCAKKEQKTLPDWLKGCGRWWYVSPDQEPKETATAYLDQWPFLIPFSVVFNKAELDGCLRMFNVKNYDEQGNYKPTKLKLPFGKLL